MKKIYFIATICLALACNCFSQEKFSIGFQAGASRTFSYHTTINKELRHADAGLSIGMYADFRLSKHIHLVILPTYDKCNFSFGPFIFESGRGNVQSRDDYINIPVTIGYTFGKKIQFHADAGIFGGLLVHQREIITTVDTTTGVQTIEHVHSDYNNINAGIAFTAGVYVPVSSKIDISLSIRDNLGLTNIPKGGGFKLNHFSTLAGLHFRFK